LYRQISGRFPDVSGAINRLKLSVRKKWSHRSLNMFGKSMMFLNPAAHAGVYIGLAAMSNEVIK
jgi:hypothetical protein